MTVALKMTKRTLNLSAGFFFFFLAITDSPHCHNMLMFSNTTTLIHMTPPVHCVLRFFLELSLKCKGPGT